MKKRRELFVATTLIIMSTIGLAFASPTFLQSRHEYIVQYFYDHFSVYKDRVLTKTLLDESVIGVSSAGNIATLKGGKVIIRDLRTFSMLNNISLQKDQFSGIAYYGDDGRVFSQTLHGDIFVYDAEQNSWKEFVKHDVLDQCLGHKLDASSNHQLRINPEGSQIAFSAPIQNNLGEFMGEMSSTYVINLSNSKGQLVGQGVPLGWLSNSKLLIADFSKTYIWTSESKLRPKKLPVHGPESASFSSGIFASLRLQNIVDLYDVETESRIDTISLKGNEDGDYGILTFVEK